MPYNATMEGKKRKFMVYLNSEQSSKLESVCRQAKMRDGRTNISEIIRELMGFPVEIGKSPVTTPEDREYLSGRRNSLPESQKPSRPASRPIVRAGHE